MIGYWLEARQKVNQAIDDFFIRLSLTVTDFFSSTGSVVIFFAQSSVLIWRKPYRFDEIIKHMEFIGNKSILIILLTGSFTGMAMAYQIYLGFNLVNATNLVGPTVALGISA